MRTQNPKKNIWSSLFLMILSGTAFTIFSILGVLYALIKHIALGHWKELYFYFEGIFYKLAVAFDQIGNILVAEFLNDLIITKEGHKFGDEDETVSEATGINEVQKTLNASGIRFNAMLTFILGVDHAKNSIRKK